VVPVTVGAACAATLGPVSINRFLLTLLGAVALHAGTNLVNDFYDWRQGADHAGSLGPSRVIQNGWISPQTVLQAGLLCFAVGSVAGLILAAQVGPSILLLGLVGVPLAYGYTAPPLKLSHRGLGELGVGLTHATGAILCGFVFQGGALGDPAPWLLSVPLALAVLPSIILAGVPDRDADRAIGKRTLAVRLGVRGAFALAGSFAALASAAALILMWTTPVGGLLAGIEYLAPLHAMLLLILLARQAPRAEELARIDGLLVAALTYMLWFVVVPLRHLLG
jgi:1,4-dihydroxy-2-naphthoate octaprenyltransferase